MADNNPDHYTKDYGDPEVHSKLLMDWHKAPPAAIVVHTDPAPRDPIRTSGYSLIPPEPMGEVARVFQIGAEKYEPRGWEKGLPWSDVVDRIHKHLGRWMRGEKFDLEDGQHNLASVAWAALVLMEFEKTHPETDDIHPKAPDENPFSVRVARRRRQQKMNEALAAIDDGGA